MSLKAGRVLLVSPERSLSARTRRLTRELSLDWETDHARPAEAQARLSRRDYSAIIFLDHPAERTSLRRLSLFTTVPIVCVLFESGIEPRACASGNGAGPGSRAREDWVRALSAAREVWSFGKPLDEAAGGTRLDLDSFVTGRPIDRAWMSPRLAALNDPPRPAARALASIVIPCWNNIRHTRECLDYLARHTSGPHELIVIDNGSTDGTADFIRRRTKARLIRNERNLGFAKAVNQGMLAATGRYVVWLNNDVLVTPGWLEGLIDCARRSSWLGAVGPCANETVGLQRVASPPYRSMKDMLRFSQAWSLKNRGRAIEAHRLVGFCLLVKSEVIRQVGLLDERFSPACYEDYDYCLRVRQAGWGLACAAAVFVHHHGHKSFASPGAMLAQSAAGREVFLDKWCHKTLGFLDELDAEASRSCSSRS